MTPSVSAASGKGSDRVFSFADLRALRTAWQLRELGVSLRRLRLVVSFLQKIDVPVADARLIVAGDDVQLVQSDGELLSVLRAPGQFRLPIVLLDLGSIQVELLNEMGSPGSHLWAGQQTIELHAGVLAC